MKYERHKLPTYGGAAFDKCTYRKKELSWFTEREFTQNIQHHIWDRECGLNRYNRRGYMPLRTATKEFHKSITPRLSILDVANDLGSVRRFSPDGKYLLSFLPVGAIRISEYASVGAVQEMLSHVKSECVKATLATGTALTNKLFPRYWELQVQSPQEEERQRLKKDFSMFIGSRYVLLCAKAYSPNGRRLEREAYLQYPDVYESRAMLYDLTFYLIDLEMHCISDVYAWADALDFSSAYGISVSGNYIALLSQRRQIIQIFEVVAGKLICQHEINREEEPIRRLLLSQRRMRRAGGLDEPLTNNVLSPLKQQVFTYMYREATSKKTAKKNSHTNTKRVLEFYKNMPKLETMKMHRIQLLNTDTLLIRFELPNWTDDSTSTDDSNENEEMYPYKLFAFYSISEKRVFKVYTNDSVELLYLQRKFYDTFQPDRSWFTGMPISTPGNNRYIRVVFDSGIYEEPTERDAALTLNDALPFPTQGVSTSPYYSYDIFDYDDRWISSLQVPQLIKEKPIQIEERLTGLVKFRLYIDTSRHKKNGAMYKEKIVTFITHPYEPFIMSVQNLGERLILNLHLYCETTIVNRGQRRKNYDIGARSYDTDSDANTDSADSNSDIDADSDMEFEEN